MCVLERVSRIAGCFKHGQDLFSLDSADFSLSFEVDFNIWN